MCGEQRIGCQIRMGHIGSPPRVRGTVASVIAMAGDERITPACAGNSFWHYEWVWGVRDHPRVCGEQGCPLDRQSPGLGSPPRVRGTGGPLCDEIVKERITPACAGNRLFHSRPLLSL